MPLTNAHGKVNVRSIKIIEQKVFLMCAMRIISMSDSNSPRFYYFCAWQFMYLSHFWCHSLFFSLFIYFVGIPSFLGHAIK